MVKGCSVYSERAYDCCCRALVLVSHLLFAAKLSIIQTVLLLFTMVSPKKRMLFLHGQFLPPECYREKLAFKFIKALEQDNWEFITVTSPRESSDDPPELVMQMFPSLTNFPEWLNAETSPEDGTKKYHSLQESLDFLQSYLHQQDRVDVICGHSNGALMASILSFYMSQQPEFIPKARKDSIRHFVIECTCIL